MKILLLAPHPFFSQRGTPIAEKMLLGVLAARGHEVDVLTYAEGEAPEIPSCRIHRIAALPFTGNVRPGFSLKKLACDAVMVWKCLGLIRRGRYDLVHAVEESAFMALLGKRLFGVPYVYDMDSGLAEQMMERFPVLRAVRPVLEGCERRVVQGSAGTLAVCGALADKAREYHPLGLVGRLEDVSLLEVSESEDGAASEPGLPAPRPAPRPIPGKAPEPLVVYVGNLERYQGVDLLLEGFARARAEVPGARLLVVGGPPEEAERYRRLSRERGLGAGVEFAGPRPVSALGGLLRRATVLVSPRTRGTNTPMKVYSYLDSGRPLLATRLPTHTQVLTDDVALLVEPEPEAFGQGLARLLRDEVLRERLAVNARALARREFTAEAFERKLLGFYGEVAHRIGKQEPAGGFDTKDERNGEPNPEEDPHAEPAERVRRPRVG